MRVDIKTPTSNNSYELDKFGKNEITFGKKAGANDIVINCDIVSRLHGAFIRRADGWYIQDRNSTNGILGSDGHRVVHEEKLRNGVQYGIRYDNTTVVMTFSGVSGIMPEQQGSSIKKVEVVNFPNPPRIDIPQPVAVSDLVEEPQAVIEMDRLHSFLSGYGICRTKATLTNKRVYVSRKNGLISRIDSTETIDNTDITGVKIVDFKPWFLIGLGVFLLLVGLIMVIASGGGTIGDAVQRYIAGSIAEAGIIVLIIAWFKFRKIVLIQYAGGSIGLRLKFVNYDQIVYFRDCLLCEKENCRRIYGNKKVTELDDVTYKY